MTTAQWARVDHYLEDLLVPTDSALDAALADSAAAGLPAHNVSPQQGKLLYLLARIRGARNMLEIGTLGGYSAIWMARALPPDGTLITLEANPKHAEVARASLVRAGLSRAVDVRVGPALETLPRLAGEGRGPFDFIFIDADKQNNTRYLAWALRLSGRGSLIIGDNIVRDGAVIDGESADPSVQGVRQFLQMLSTEPRVSATAIQTVGSKGYDGFTLALVTGD